MSAAEDISTQIQAVPVQLAQLCDDKRVPKLLRAHVAALAILQPEMPLPMSLLARLWQTDSGSAEAAASLLEQLGCIRLATLQDGSGWALLTQDFSEEIQACMLASGACALAWHCAANAMDCIKQHEVHAA